MENSISSVPSAMKIRAFLVILSEVCLQCVDIGNGNLVECCLACLLSHAQRWASNRTILPSVNIYATGDAVMEPDKDLACPY